VIAKYKNLKIFANMYSSLINFCVITKIIVIYQYLPLTDAISYSCVYVILYRTIL